MPKLGLLRHRCAVAILCCLQLIVFIILVYASYNAEGQAYKLSWDSIVQPLFCLSTVFGLIGLCVENNIVMIIFAVLLIITTIVHANETLDWILVVVDVIRVGEHFPMIGIFIVIGCIIIISLYIYTVVSAFKLSKAYRRPPIQSLPLTAN